MVPYTYINFLVPNRYWQNSVVLNYIFYCSQFHYNSSTRSLSTIIFWYNCDSCSWWWLIFYTFFVVIVAMVHFSKYSLEVISVRRYQRFGFPCFSNSWRFFRLKWDILESRILMIVCESKIHIMKFHEIQFVECDKEYSLLWKANVIISFNNRPATEAVPYFEQVLCCSLICIFMSKNFMVLLLGWYILMLWILFVSLFS